MLYPKIDTLFERDPLTFKVIPGRFKNEAFSLINEWEWTEKIDGTNIRVIYDPTRFLLEKEISEYVEGSDIPYANNLIPLPYKKELLKEMDIQNHLPYVEYGGRTDNAELPSGVVEYLDSIIDADKMCDLFQGKKVVIYGEGYGAKIQNGGGYSNKQKFIVFDIVINGYWLKRPDVEGICAKLGLDVVPLIPYISSSERARIMVSEGFKSQLGDGSVEAEGLIGRTSVPLFDGKGRRIICKLKTKDFK